ncbi:MAG: hypothetical protein QM762_09175 [Chryseolinea sp.]
MTIAFISLATPLLRGQAIPEKNDPKKHPHSINKTFVDKIEGRPIDFYLNHKRIDTPAKLFYQGKFAVTDDEETFAFLDSVMTRNPETRSFYQFIFNRVMELSDGALSEQMSVMCRRYFEKYPCEALANLNTNITKTERDKWIEFIAFDLYDKKAFDLFATGVEKQLTKKCSSNKSYWDKVKAGIAAKLEER